MHFLSAFATILAATVPVSAGLLAGSLPGCPADKVNVTQNSFAATPMMSRFATTPMSSHRNLMLSKRSSDFVTFAYYVNWAVYELKVFPWQLPLDSITHLPYAFANVNNVTGEVSLSDTYADQQIRFSDPSLEQPDSTEEDPDNLYGVLKRLNLAKRKNRNLKVLLSIGGYTYSPNFWPSLSTEEGRQLFVNSSVTLLEQNGFDGLDVDWEYVATEEQSKAFTDLLRKLRKALDEAASKRKGPKPYFYITAAVSAGYENNKALDVPALSELLDYFNVMNYDFSGPWSSLTANSANLYDSPHSPCSEASGAASMNNYLDRGAPASKLLFGLPLYGHAFANTSGLNKPFEGTGNGSYDDPSGAWKLKDLPQPGAEVVCEKKAGASYSYDKKKRLFISYDNPEVFRQKTEYIKRLGFAGPAFWDTTGDYNASSPNGKPTIPMVHKLLGEAQYKENCLEYPFSNFNNLRNGFNTTEITRV